MKAKQLVVALAALVVGSCSVALAAEPKLELVVQTGHTSWVTSVALSGDGRRVLTGSSDQTAILWDAVSGTKLRTFQGHTAGVTSVALSGDGRRALTGSHDGSAIVWGAVGGGQLQTLRGHRTTVDSVALSGDGRLALTGSSDRTAILWDATAGAKLHTFRGHTSFVGSVALSGDGRLALTGSWDKTAVLWDTVSGAKLQTLQGHTDSIASVALSGDSRRILTAGDGTARLWDAVAGKELCQLISLDAGKDWLVVTPEGYFDGSPNAARFVSYRIAGTLEFVPLERYRKQFDRPGLLALVMKGEDPRGKSTVVRDLPPKVRVVAPVPGAEVKDSKLTVQAEAESRGEYPVTTFRLLLNGRPYPKKLGVFDVAEPALGKTTARWDIELEPGKHTLEVLAYTRAVYGASDPLEVRYTGGRPTVEIELPTLYVLAVGISKYPRPDSLDYAHRDAEAIARAYQQHSKAFFKKIEVKVLTDENATRDAIMDGLDWLRRGMTQKDFGVFFFAGHGVRDERDAVYFLPIDGDKDKLARTAIDGDVLAKELTSTVGQLTVILDACHAGAIGGKKRGLTEGLLRDLSSEERGVAMMCSASGLEKAQESHEHRQGLFTVALLEGLRGTGNGKKGADEIKVTRSKDGAVYFKQQDAYVTERVKEMSKGYQHPVTCIPRTFRDFPVSKP